MMRQCRHESNTTLHKNTETKLPKRRELNQYLVLSQPITVSVLPHNIPLCEIISGNRKVLLLMIEHIRHSGRF